MKIKFEVEYYDKKEKELFKAAGQSGRLTPLVSNGLSIDELDLISAGMLMEQKNKPGWRSRRDLTKKAAGRIDQFTDYFDTTAGTLTARHDPADMGANTEWMGVGASIAAMEEAFSLHDADWERIPVSDKKDLDFSVASTGTSFVVVEAKGSVVDDPGAKSPAVSNHKADIKAKKDVQKTERSGDVLVGTIAAIPRTAGQSARIWLVDPPLPRVFSDPARFKLLSRMRYYRELLRVIGRPRLLFALSDRIAAIERIGDFTELDGLPLVGGDERTFGVPPSFINNRSHSKDGRLVVMPRRWRGGLVLFGLDIGVVPLLTAQDFEGISKWSSQIAGRFERNFSLLLRPADADGIPGLRPQGDARTDGRRVYQASCDIMVTASGLVLGTIGWVKHKRKSGG